MLKLDVMLDKVREADRKQAVSQYEISNMLTAIKDHDLFEQLGYINFNQMVASELSFSPSTALAYCSLYTHLTRLRYTKDESIKFLQAYGWRQVQFALKNQPKKIGIRALGNAIEARAESRNQWNFNFNDQQLANRLTSVLGRYGLEENENGHRQHMTESLEKMLDHLETLTSTRQAA